LIKTKSIYDKKEESDGKRILITRYYPRGISKDNFYLWYRDLSPSRHLLKSLKHGIISRSVFSNFSVEICATMIKNRIMQTISNRKFEQRYNFTML